ncbi:MAG: dihydroorotate dehydrogenase [Thermoplasmata archaeon]|nr:MAG: dihydroorotate dehydrogenase [Thermoplasmata archaeon]
MIDISTNIASLKLENPTILASGILDETAGSMISILENGAAAVVTKSIGLKPRKGYPNPTIIELEYGILNAMGLPNPGIKEYREEIIEVKRNGGIIIGSIFGSTPEEFISLAEKMESYGVNALELNLSCPHASGYGLEVGQDRKLVKTIVEEVKNSVHIPVFAKISSNLSDISSIAKAIIDGDADGIVAINTVKAMTIDLELQKPILSNKIGGYSGRAIKPIGVRCVYEITEEYSIPVIGVGGIVSGEDALEYIMAGASAVEIGSGIYYRGVDIFKKICREIESWMELHNYRNIKDLIGVAH